MAINIPPKPSITQIFAPTLPIEIWLQILKGIPTYEAEHLWISIRHVSLQFRDYVDALFITTYLPQFTLSLALPCRDPDTGALTWRYAIPSAQILMSFERLAADQCYAIFVSPLEIKDRDMTKSVEELRATNALPRERLIKAPTWVYANNNYMAGRIMAMRMGIDWDAERRRWIWQVDWRTLITRHYRTRMEARTKWYRR
ncbi:hypothetical protein GQ44DRAFT_827461 [Phaeosphaeriaceae sp. PMI808]|nr:hypothetical protein GQ44DRAFT_827461 [Phaeosphaeriaceae sp. PMI808]